MFHKTLAWYRSLSTGWKYLAWIVLVIVAVASALIFAIPWLASSNLRAQVRTLKAEAAVDKATRNIAEKRQLMDGYKAARDRALESEKKHAESEGEVDGRIAQIDEQLAEDQQQVKGQTDEKQADWFTKRYKS